MLRRRAARRTERQKTIVVEATAERVVACVKAPKRATLHQPADGVFEVSQPVVAQLALAKG